MRRRWSRFWGRRAPWIFGFALSGIVVGRCFVSIPSAADEPPDEPATAADETNVESAEEVESLVRKLDRAMGGLFERNGGAEDDSSGEKPERNGNLNLALPTIGGVQFWADELCYLDWKIQRHAETGHCRLIDGSNVRRAWGTFEECQRELDAIRQREQLPEMSGRAIVVLHGLGGFPAVMSPLANRLRENSDALVFNLAYPSTRADLASHARSLASVIEHLEGIERIDFVAHSLGNTVIRYYLGESERSSKGIDPRIGRMVMIAPPNQKSERAQWFGKRRLASKLLGKSFVQLGAEWDEIKDKLGAPPGEFGIIAGGLGNDKGFSPFVNGDDDGLLSVEGTKLEGAADFKVIEARHTLLLIDGDVHDCVARFLETGRFEEVRLPSRICGCCW